MRLLSNRYLKIELLLILAFLPSGGLCLYSYISEGSSLDLVASIGLLGIGLFNVFLYFKDLRKDKREDRQWIN